MGVSTNRDAWVYSFDVDKLKANTRACIHFYNAERKRWQQSLDNKEKKMDAFLNNDKKKISWTRGLKRKLEKNTIITFDEKKIQKSLDRPFCKQYLYFDENLNEMQLLQTRLKPSEKERNIQIIASGSGHSKEFSCLVTDLIPCLDAIEKGQSFPLYWYENASSGKHIRHEAVSSEILRVFKSAFPAGFTGRLKKDGGPEISKEDIFYYIYGILHSPEYRERFVFNLKKELPRIPLSRNFASFAVMGRQLAELHLNYEQAEMYPLEIVGDIKTAGPVIKMRWGKKKDPKTGQKLDDHSVLVYNENLTFKNIPEEADRYVVNGRTPLEWMIDRYQIKMDKNSGIVNDPNEYSDDPLYIPQLIQRLVTVSVETTRIVEHMPALAEIEQIVDWPEEWKK